MKIKLVNRLLEIKNTDELLKNLKRSEKNYYGCNRKTYRYLILDNKHIKSNKKCLYSIVETLYLYSVISSHSTSILVTEIKVANQR